MKKTIIYLGMAFIAFTNASFATQSVQSSNPFTLVYRLNTPLCNAVAKGDLEAVKKFIEYGVDVNEATNGVTPLMIAARYNNIKIIKLLVENGAKVETKDERGNTALKYATLSNAVEAEAYLKEI